MLPFGVTHNKSRVSGINPQFAGHRPVISKGFCLFFTLNSVAHTRKTRCFQSCRRRISRGILNTSGFWEETLQHTVLFVLNLYSSVEDWLTGAACKHLN